MGGADVQKVCSPTRTAIMTGRYPHRNGMQTPFCGGSPEGLNLNETLMSEYMNTAGSASPKAAWPAHAPEEKKHIKSIIWNS